MKTEFKCPLCDELMDSVPGDRVNPRNGVTLICFNPLCPPHENVEGHGKNEKEAYEVACQKFKKDKKMS